MSTGAGTGTARTWMVGAAVVGATLLAVVAIGGGGGDGAPLSPRSDRRGGTSALVTLARELGADVSVRDSLPALPAGGGPDVLLLFDDQLTDDQHGAVRDWVSGGGVLVVTDELSPFAPTPAGSFAEDDAPGGRCDIGALSGIDVGGVRPRRGGVYLHPAADAETCVTRDFGYAYIVATPRGDGTVVAVGGPGMFVNVALAEGQNAPVVAALVAPQESTDLVVLEPGPLAGSGAAAGGRTLGDLVPTGVKRALVQLGIAFAVYALVRARRLGRPVSEPQPVAVAGSELVAAVGGLLDRARSPQHAAALLRGDLHRFLVDRLGLPADVTPDVLARVAAERTGLDEGQLAMALGTAPVADDAGLLALADTIDRIREEVLAHV